MIISSKTKSRQYWESTNASSIYPKQNCSYLLCLSIQGIIKHFFDLDLNIFPRNKKESNTEEAISEQWLVKWALFLSEQWLVKRALFLSEEWLVIWVLFLSEQWLVCWSTWMSVPAQYGFILSPDPSGENGLTLAHIKASVIDTADVPSSRK